MPATSSSSSTEANGPFASVDELLDVSGITEHRLDAIIPYVVAR